LSDWATAHPAADQEKGVWGIIKVVVRKTRGYWGLVKGKKKRGDDVRVVKGATKPKKGAGGIAGSGERRESKKLSGLWNRDRRRGRLEGDGGASALTFL